MSMQINYTCTGVGGDIANNYLRFQYFETSDPLAIVRESVLPPVHSFPLSISQEVDNPVPHIVKIFTTPDPDQLGTLLTDFMYNPTWTNVEVRLPLQITVGGPGPYDPSEGSTTVVIDGSVVTDPVIESIATFDWWVEMRSRSGKLRDDEYVKNIDNTGFEFADGFYEPDTIWICFAPKISVAQPTYNYLKLFNGVNVITESEVVTSEHFNKVNEIVGATEDAITITFPAFNTIPLNSLFTYNTNRGKQKQVSFVCDPGEVFNVWNDDGLTAIFLGERETLQILRSSDGWHVTSELTGMMKAGMRVRSDTGLIQASIQPNFRACDGSALPRVKYPRAEWYAEQLPGGQLIPIGSRSAANKNLGMWAQDAENIYLPDELGCHPRNIPGGSGRDSGRDNSSVTGSIDGSYLKDHLHHTTVDQELTSSQFPNQIGRAITALRSFIKGYNKNSGSGKESYTLAGAESNGNIPTLGPTSPSNDRRPGQSTTQFENTVLTVGHVAGVFI